MAVVDTVAWISTKNNDADVITERLSKRLRGKLFWNWTYGCCET